MTADLFSSLGIVHGAFVPVDDPRGLPPETGDWPVDDGLDGPPPLSPTGGDPAPDPDAGPTCEVCGKAVPLTPSGRRPRKPLCQDHKTRGPATEGAPRESASGKAHEARLARITGDLQQGVGELAATIVPIAPITSVTMVSQAPGAIDAMVRISAKYPRMLDALETISKGVPFVEIGKFVCAMVLAVMVDFGRANPYGIVGQRLGVAEAAREAGWTPSAEAAALERQQNAADARNVKPTRDRPAPPRFKL